MEGIWMDWDGTLANWEHMISSVSMDKKSLNRLVIDYLVTEGYSEAASAFQEESNTSYHIPGDNGNAREQIRTVLQQGDVQHGIEILNDLNPEILDTNPSLVFALKRQQFIELVRDGKLEDALLFAEQELAPRTEENVRFEEFWAFVSLTEELESAMSLFAFDIKNVTDTPVGSLMDNSQRQNTASEVNAAILRSTFQERDAKLKLILQSMVQSESKLETVGSFPTIDFTGKLSLSNDGENKTN